jgi:putative mRNA 3-end processing factor
MSPLLKFNSCGIYCELADIYIDPWKPVNKAIITHAHSDHARWGNKYYLSHKDSASILKLRLGNEINLETVEYGHTFRINNVNFSLHPAGHIIGSAQIRIEYKGEIWVVSGDYKLENDNFCQPYESIPCHSFITESTFGLPIYRWQPQEKIFSDIKNWWKENRILDKCSVLMGYSLGKMQRLIINLKEFEGPVYCHGSVYNINEQLRLAGFDLPFIPHVNTITDRKLFRTALILAPSSAMNTSWIKKFQPYSTGYCSGWMALRGTKNRKAVDRGFVLSDHIDWPDLNLAVKNSGAENIYVTHGYTSVYSKYLNENGIRAFEVKTQYGEEEEETVSIEENL